MYSFYNCTPRAVLYKEPISMFLHSVMELRLSLQIITCVTDS